MKSFSKRARPEATKLEQRHRLFRQSRFAVLGCFALGCLTLLAILLFVRLLGFKSGGVYAPGPLRVFQDSIRNCAINHETGTVEGVVIGIVGDPLKPTHYRVKRMGAATSRGAPSQALPPRDIAIVTVRVEPCRGNYWQHEPTRTPAQR